MANVKEKNTKENSIIRNVKVESIIGFGYAIAGIFTFVLVMLDHFSFSQWVILLVAGLMVISMVTLYTITRNIMYQRQTKMLDVLQAWADGNMAARVTDIHGTGLIAQASWSVNNVGDRMEVFLQEVQSSVGAISDGNFDRRIDTRGLYLGMKQVGDALNTSLDNVASFTRKAVRNDKRIHEFDGVISSVSESLERLSTDTDETADTLAAMAAQSSAQAINVVAGAQNASDNVSTVAAATEELTASISEVSRQVTEASKVTEEAVIQANDTTETVTRLSQESKEIGSVVQVISDIAEQTNLLALNASIEAARAGEAGRGFAVVADEVKELAAETAKATDQIARQVKQIQAESSEATKTIGAISETIRRINEINNDINVATDQQAQAALEISSSIQHANESVTDVTTNISDVAKGVEETGRSAESLTVLSESLKVSTIHLSKEVEVFLTDLAKDDEQKSTVA